MLLRSRSSFADAPRRGIALLVTIILLSFLVLLMVAMSSLVRVETKVAANQDSLAQARQNALMGLNIAVAKLQESAGPDQRMTARADLIENSIAAGSRYQMNLTGVWDPKSATPDEPITWLVNGNEDLRGQDPTLDPRSSNSPTRSKTATGANTLIFDVTNDNNVPDGHPIHSLASLLRYDDQFPPAQVFAPLPAGEFRFGDGHVYLVGNGSLDIDPSSAAPNPPLASGWPGNSYKYAIDERVIVRKSPIIVDGGKLPGRDPGPVATPTPYTVGHYAYWVGDAGIKASLSAAHRVDEINHDDFTAGDGADYNPANNTATDPNYIARKLLNGMQLQGNRYDLLFRPEPGAGDIFANGGHPSFLLDRLGGTVGSANRTPFYGVIMHPTGRDIIHRLQNGSQFPYLAQMVYQDPLITLNTREDYEAVIGHRLKQLFHDVTPQTYGVLTNMRLGGLRYDLSYLDRAKYKSPADFTSARSDMPGTTAADIRLDNVIAGLESFANVWRPSKGAAEGSAPVGVTSADLLRLRVPIVPPATLTPAAGATSFPLVPVITEMSIIGTLRSDPDGNLRLGMTGQVELWNPYNAQLDLPAGQTLKLAIVAVKDSAPVLRDLKVEDNGNSFPGTVSVARSLGWNGTAADFSLSVNLTGESAAAKTGRWAPGQITKWNFTLLATDTNAKNLSGSVAGGYSISATDFNITSPGATTVSVELQMGNRPLSSVAGVALAEVTTDVTTNLFQYYFRLNEDSDYTNDSWLKSTNPLGPAVVAQAASGSGTTAKPATITTAALLDIGTPATPTLDATTTNLLLLNDSTAGATPVVLYDVPRQDLVGVGALRHLVVNPASVTRTNAIGAKGAGVPNDVFEDFFFSTIPGDQNAWGLKSGKPLPNTSIVVADPAPGANTPPADLWRDTTPPVNTTLTGLQSANSAQYLMVKDAFNINSTSVVAWRALLGGALPTLADPGAGNDYRLVGSLLSANWRYYDGSAVKTEPLRNAFFRFPQTAPDVGLDFALWEGDLANADDNIRRRAAYRVGVRELTDAQVDSLAVDVVDTLKARGEPFPSVAAFIEAGVLQDAIDSIPGINSLTVGAPAADRLPEGSPAYLSQGDILELIGHRLFARSDTFTIRVYGDVTEPTLFSTAANHEIPKVTSRVWLEATVQRTPIKHPTADDPDDNMTPTDPTAVGAGRSEVGNFGRQFRILNIRWLRPDEV